MAEVLVLGAGIAGHTATAYLKRRLGSEHKIKVISPSQYFTWIPSNIWVGVGRMSESQVRFSLKPLYDRWKVEFYQAQAIELFPEGNHQHQKSFVRALSIENKNTTVDVEYDYLVIATGPKLNYEATPGLEDYAYSVCSTTHAQKAWEGLTKVFEEASNGKRQRIVVGTGHPTATCQGAAFEYALNIAFESRVRKLDELIEIIWITNEYEVGDFGMNGAFVKRNGYVVHTREFTESILAENNIKWIKRAGVKKLEKGKLYYELIDGTEHSLDFDFAMLIPQFTGVPLKAFDKAGNLINDKLFSSNGFVKVDADYTPKEFEEYSINDWPSTYQNPNYDNIYAIGIAFAPPHSISKPMKSPNGTYIYATPPRTGMPSGVMGKIVALNIANRIKYGRDYPHKHKASMGKMGAACIISAGYGLFKGSAATLTVNPIVPDWDRYPQYGRNLNYTIGEIGLSSHWTKLFLHYMFLYKAKGKPFWWLIPE